MPKFIFAGSQRKFFEHARLAIGISSDKDKSAKVGHQHYAIMLPIALHLLGAGNGLDILLRRFCLDPPARRQQSLEGFSTGSHLGAGTPKLVSGE